MTPVQPPIDLGAVTRVLTEVANERVRQVEKWGLQIHPDGTGPELIPGVEAKRDAYRDECDLAGLTGQETWAQILFEEFFEALSETESVPLRKELVQVAAVCAAWIEDLDRRGALQEVPC